MRPLRSVSNVRLTKRNHKTSHSVPRADKQDIGHALRLVTSQKERPSMHVTKMAESYSSHAKAPPHISLFQEKYLKQVLQLNYTTNFL